MNRILRLAGMTLAAAVALSFAAPPAEAQKKQPQKKLYRWVDAQGKVQISDTLPPEMVGNARQELNATGRTTSTLDRELTPEERAAQDILDAQQATEAERLAEQQRNEDAMLQSYATEEDLKRAYNERIGLLKQTLESTDVSLMSLRSSLASQLADASESELQNRKVDEKRLAKIRELHDELTKQHRFQANRHVELIALDAEFVRVLERYRQRRSEEAAAAAAPAAAPVPPGG